LPLSLLLCMRRGSSASGALLALIVAVAAPAPAPASAFPLLLALFAPRVLGIRRGPRIGLGLVATRVLALLLRMFVAGGFRAPVLMALLLAAGTAAVA
jgi:hypothetical protein